MTYFRSVAEVLRAQGSGYSSGLRRRGDGTQHLLDVESSLAAVRGKDSRAERMQESKSDGGRGEKEG